MFCILFVYISCINFITYIYTERVRLYLTVTIKCQQCRNDLNVKIRRARIIHIYNIICIGAYYYTFVNHCSTYVQDDSFVVNQAALASTVYYSKHNVTLFKFKELQHTILYNIANMMENIKIIILSTFKKKV